MGARQHEDPNLVTASHHDMLASVLGSKKVAAESMLYSYKHGFSGFSATLTESQAKQISRIWPELRSFNDLGYSPIPSRWKGICEEGEEFNASHCNRKIIGARWYARGLDRELLQRDYLSPHEINGHDTHIASTVAGSIVSNVSVEGLGARVARGGAPCAHLAIYKVAWASGASSDSAVLAAIDDVIHDGVDILSLSLGFDYLDISFGYLHAVENGITVVFSASNDGPRPQSISNESPWVITVAANTIDRSFPASITLGKLQSRWEITSR